MFLAGDVEINPGPPKRGRKPKWPCGLCSYAVKNNDSALLCDHCDLWFHNRCSGVSDASYLHYQNLHQFTWICPACDIIHFEDSFFSTDNFATSSPKTNVSANPRFVKQRDRKQSESVHGNSRSKVKTPPNSTVKVAVVNFRGIAGKIPLFHTFLETENPDVIIGTESWLDESIQSAEIFPSNFSIFRRDRPQGNRGGVFIAVRDSLPVTERADFCVENSEILWCQLTLKPANEDVFIGVFYRRPSSYNQDTLNGLNDSLTKLFSGLNSPFVILGGDFNIPDMEWKPDDTTFASGGLQTKILEIADDYHMEQKVGFPTRKDPVSGVENILDLLFTSRPSAVNNVRPASGLSDHEVVLADISIKTTHSTKPPRTIFKWNSVDETDFRVAASELKDDFFHNNPEEKTVEYNWTFLRDGLNNIVQKFVPQKTIRGKIRPRWLTTDLLRLTRKKERFYVRAKKSGKQTDWEKFKAVRKYVDRELRKAHRAHVEAVTSTDDPKKFWRYIKSQRKNTSGVQVLKVNGADVTGDKEKSEVLANQFSSVFTREDSSQLPYLPDSIFPDMLNIHVSVEGVLKLLQSMDVSKAAGPDQIPNRALKLAAKEIAPMLAHIFQQSLDSGDLPSDWKKANITPLFKQGSTADPGNYKKCTDQCL